MTESRPPECCGRCPAIVGGGYDCTCGGNPRCTGPTVIRKHVNAGGRCMICDLSEIDQVLYGPEDGEDCIPREPMVYTTESKEEEEA